MEWKGKVIDSVDKKIKTLSSKTFSKFHKSIRASFLNLSIMIGSNKFKAQLYDYGVVFSFSVVRMLHWDINIPSSINNTSIGSERLRFTRTTFDINTYVTLSDRLLKKMQKKEVNIDP